VDTRVLQEVRDLHRLARVAAVLQESTDYIGCKLFAIHAAREGAVVGSTIVEVL